MKNIFKNTGRVVLAAGLLATTMLSSCLKDNSPGKLNFGDSPSLIGFQYAGFAAQPYTVAILNNPGIVYTSVEVTLSTPSVTLGSDVTATLQIDDAGANTYIAADTAGGRVDHILPSSLYKIQSTVTIPAGKTTVVIPVTLAGDQIDFTQNYVLGIKLVNANGATIASNLQSAVLVVKLKSLYEGSYTASGARTRFNGSTEASGVLDMFPVSGTVGLSTYTADIVTGQAGDTGSGYTWALQVNATGTPPYSVTVLPDPTAAAGGTPASFTQGTAKGPSTYDPATKTFSIHVGYLNGAGALREIDETLVAK